MCCCGLRLRFEVFVIATSWGQSLWRQPLRLHASALSVDFFFFLLLLLPSHFFFVSLVLSRAGRSKDRFLSIVEGPKAYWLLCFIGVFSIAYFRPLLSETGRGFFFNVCTYVLTCAVLCTWRPWLCQALTDQHAGGHGLRSYCARTNCFLSWPRPELGLSALTGLVRPGIQPHRMSAKKMWALNSLPSNSGTGVVKSLCIH